MLIKIDHDIYLNPDTVDRVVRNSHTGKTIIHTIDDFFFISDLKVSEVMKLISKELIPANEEIISLMKQNSMGMTSGDPVAWLFTNKHLENIAEDILNRLKSTVE